VALRELQKLWMIQKDGAAFIAAYVRVEPGQVVLLAYAGERMSGQERRQRDRGRRQTSRRSARLELVSRQVFETIDEAIVCADFAKGVWLKVGFADCCDDGQAFEPVTLT
jgi:hypothetical protein